LAKNPDGFPEGQFDIGFDLIDELGA